MTDINLTDLQIDSLVRLTFEESKDKAVTAVLLALGSNYQADYYLPRVRKSLAKLGEIKLSTAFQNPDFTATKEQPKPDYTNQAIYLCLKESVTLGQLEQVFKSLEGECGRQRSAETQFVIKQVTVKQVSMDIDILLIKLDHKQNSLSNNSKNEWVVMADRYPFKAHEMTGIAELQK